jgi:hypothetical protein
MLSKRTAQADPPSHIALDNYLPWCKSSQRGYEQNSEPRNKKEGRRKGKNIQL